MAPRKKNLSGNADKKWFPRPAREGIATTIDDRFLWRILLPVANNEGMVFPDQKNKKFSDRVLKTSHGSTENPWSQGKWFHRGRLYRARMIPFEFLGTTAQAEKIAAFACKHYDQMEILYYPISDSVRHCRRTGSWVQSLGRNCAAWLRKSAGNLRTMFRKGGKDAE